ncbi:MAG: hypothetical protein HQ500_08890 [Flavobacteriales bacterium]|nr:hypothetical protein [Flavobacteriales bacterium]
MNSIGQVTAPHGINIGSKTAIKLDFFQRLFDELRGRDIPQDMVEKINTHILTINSLSGSEAKFRRLMRRSQRKILDLLVKELKLVPKNYHRNMWVGLGMAVFGVPIGVSWGISAENMGMIGVGIPLGMVIGIAIGTSMDKKALAEGRQLNVAMEY